MKVILSISLVASAALISGCAFNGQPAVLNAVGRSPQALAGVPKGTLVVYSSYDPNPDFNYTLFSSQGKVLQTVYHNTGGVIERPAQVELPVGGYRVMAWAKGYQTVTVPVVILRDQVTTVQLGGSS